MPRPFEAIVEAAIERARALAANGPIELIGHSIGGLIGASVADRIPALVAKLTLVSSELNPVRGFLRFGEKLAIDPALLASARRELTPATFWPVVTAIAQVPDLSARYWGRRAAATRDVYLKESSRNPGLDMAVFRAVMNDLLKNPRTLTAGKFTGPVDLWLGDEDPLIDATAESANWRAIYPQLRSEIMPGCWHFIHFEIDPALWRFRA